LFSQSDAINGVQQTPAGIGATVVASQLEAYFSPTDLANLESAQVNPIRLLAGVGFCIFGGLTTAAAYPSRYINISRTLMKIAHDMVYLTNFAIFQNNTPQLWQSISTVLTNYLLQQMQAKLLYGSTQSQAFVVICDSTVNTPATIQAGIVNASVAVAIAAPAEFVVINLSQMVSGGTTSISS
jgi:phage tail sheath protein FI